MSHPLEFLRVSLHLCIHEKDVNREGSYLASVFSLLDDVAHNVKSCGSGVLINTVGIKYILLCILIYADDILLVSRSPYGLEILI